MTARPPSRARTARAAGTALALALLVAACGGPQELDLQEAEDHYDEVVADLQEALEPLGHELVHAPATSSFELVDGLCTYTPGSYQADTLGADLAAEENWDAVLDAIDPVLEEHGFDTVDAPRQQGAVLMAATSDEHGAELSFGATGTVRLAGAHVSAEACDGQ